jgi:hypothetical protein
MARGGARPGAGRPARKSPNTSPPSTRARARAREAAGNQRPWPADKVERWAIDRLIPYAKNATTHTDAQIAAIAASIKEWGWTTPALVGEDGGLIAGHARILAAASGWSGGRLAAEAGAAWIEARYLDLARCRPFAGPLSNRRSRPEADVRTGMPHQQNSLGKGGAIRR